MHGKPIRASGSKSRSLRCVPLLSYVRDRHGTLFKNMDGKTLDAGPEQALGELRAALAIYRSAESGRWEPVWD